MPRAVKQHLVQRPDGRYRCKYKGKEFYGNTEQEAFEARKDYIDSLNNGEVFTPVTVTDYALPWLKRTYPAVKQSTYAGLATHLQHLVDSIGYKHLADVTPSDVKQVYADHYADLSNTYILSAKQLYCSLFDAAVADRLISSNPARATKPHKGKKPQERILSRQEREWINTFCKDHRAYPLVMTMLYAGIRPQEAKAFDIDRDVDFENNIITVQATAHIDPENSSKYALTDEMKTDWSKRTVPLFPPLKEALTGKHGLLIPSVHGEQITHNSWRRVWDSYLTNMETSINGIQKRWYGVRKDQKGKDLPPWVEFNIVPYTLRHAFCQMCRDFEVDINTCRKWMGHADTKMILKVYDSVSTDRSVNETQKVEERLRGQNGGQKN